MHIKSIRLIHIRSYESFTIELDPGVTAVLGQNGTGKTTLLESLYFLTRGTSFRGRDRDMIAYEASIGELKIDFTDGSARSAKLLRESENKVSKQFKIEPTTTARLAQKNRLPVVLFEPDELRLLTSSPQRRRDFIDGIIARLSPTYSTVLSRFARTLLQRNELLKQYDTMSHNVWESHMFAWDVKLAELSASIIKARRNFISHSNNHLSRLYMELSNVSDTVTARYVSFFNQSEDSLQQAVLHKLEITRQSDAIRGFTSLGPHRDDIDILLNTHSASESASRGEMRTIMLAFKLLEVELQLHHTTKKPLILLDDVFSELDSSREQALMEALSGYQTVITATDLRDGLKTNATIIQL